MGKELYICLHGPSIPSYSTRPTFTILSSLYATPETDTLMGELPLVNDVVSIMLLFKVCVYDTKFQFIIIHRKPFGQVHKNL